MAFALLSALLGSLPIEAAPAADFAIPLDEDRVFYRWQSTTSGESLAKLGTLNASTNAHFMGLTEDVSAGPGVYVAGTELSSSQYLPKKGGNLLEVRIPKGTRFVDLTDPETLERLHAAHVTVEELYENRHADDGLVIKYARDWYVGKNLTNKAQFSMYPGPTQSPDRMVDVLKKTRLANEKVHAQLIRQVAVRHPDLPARAYPAAKLEPAFLDLLPPDDLVRVLREHVNERLPAPAAKNLMQHFAKDPKRLEEILKRDPNLYDRVADSIMAWYPGQTRALKEAELKVAESLITRRGGDEAAREARLMAFAGRSQAAAGTWGPGASQRIAPYLNGVDSGVTNAALSTNRCVQLIETDLGR